MYATADIMALYMLAFPSKPRYRTFFACKAGLLKLQILTGLTDHYYCHTIPSNGQDVGDIERTENPHVFYLFPTAEKNVVAANQGWHPRNEYAVVLVFGVVRNFVVDGNSR